MARPEARFIQPLKVWKGDRLDDQLYQIDQLLSAPSTEAGNSFTI